jgi:hypothetical protein
MAVGIRLRFSGGNQDQYEMVHAYMGFAGNPPEGLIFHVGGPIYGGWGVQEVWVSYEAFDRFVAQASTRSPGPRRSRLAESARG